MVVGGTLALMLAYHKMGGGDGDSGGGGVSGGEQWELDDSLPQVCNSNTITK